MRFMSLIRINENAGKVPSERLIADMGRLMDEMIKAGLPAERLQAFGYGSKIPLAGNDSDAGKAKNRRIDFVVR